MYEQHTQRPQNKTGREESSRKRTRSPQPQHHEIGRDGRRSRISRSPSTSSNRASIAISSGRSTSPQLLNASDIFSQMRSEWQIEPKSHLPLHLLNCRECALFAQHVRNETSGGALEIFNQKQRHHWREVFDKEIEDRCLEAYRCGQKDNDAEISKLKDDLSWYRRRVENLEKDINDTERRYNTPRASYQHGGSQRPSTSFGRGGSRPLQAERKRSPSPIRHQLSAPVASSSKRQLTPPPQMAVETKPNPIHAVTKEKEPPRLLRRMYLTDEEDDDVVSIHSGNMDHVGGDKNSPPHSDAEEKEEELGLLSIYIGDQAPFRLHNRSNAFRSRHGHTCMDLRGTTHWDTTSHRLFRKREANKSNHWIWRSSFPMQMAREASVIPFDQRSLAQRWTVQEATRDAFLPLGSTSMEPDIESLAKNGLLPAYIRRGDGNRLNVKDVTAWLLFKMTEPEEPELVEWFWWTSCTLFGELGRYANEMSALGLRDDSHALAPLRFIQNGEPDQEALIRHFKLCGVRIQDANEHLLDFSKIYIANTKPPTVPDWSRINPSKPRVSRPSVNQRHKRGDKAFTDRGLPVPERSQRRLVDRIGDGSHASSRTSPPPVYFDRTPLDPTPKFPSEPQTGNSSQPPTNEDRMHIE
jgi:hypothetical protein